MFWFTAINENVYWTQKISKNETTEGVVNGQKKRRRFRNKTGSGRVEKKKAKPTTTEVIEIIEPVPPDKDKDKDKNKDKHKNKDKEKKKDKENDKENIFKRE